MNAESIEKIETQIIDLPLKRIHKFSATTINTKSFLIVRIYTNNGIMGIGEATTPGGPWWAGEAVETIKVMIDTYLAPALIGENALQTKKLLLILSGIAAGNPFAKAALEMALLDIKGKALDVPVYELFGGLLRESMPVKWPLAQGDPAADIAEAEVMMSARLAQEFKVKMGYMNPDDDVKYITQILEGLDGRAPLCGDLNASWNEINTQKYLPVLIGEGLDMLEQPVAAWNKQAMARIRQTSTIPILADEAVCTPQDVNEINACDAADMLSLKFAKSGGLYATQHLAQLADAYGISCFAGTFLESSIGTSAFMHLAAAQGNIDGGSELIGPIWLADDIVQNPVTYKDNHVWVKHEAGLGVSLDEDKITHYQRK